MSRAALLCVIAACGRVDFEALPETGTFEEPLCSDGWCWESPLPQGDPIYALHGTGPDDIWAVGGRGLVMHYDGAAWTISRFGEHDLWGVHASSASDIWVGDDFGEMSHYDGAAWTTTVLDREPTYGQPAVQGMWGAASNDIWAIAELPAIAHYDGTRWTTRQAGAGSSYYHSVWGTASNDVWFLGDNTTLHWDGQTISNPGAPTGVDGVGWGSAPDDMWVADVNNSIHHFDGSTWTLVPHSDWYSSLSGWSPRKGETWIGSYDGYLGHGTRSGIETITMPDLDLIWTFWGASADDAWMAGYGGRLYHFDGATWSPYYAPAPEELIAISGTTADNLWAAGRDGSLLRRDPLQGWQRVYEDVEPLGGVATTSPTDVWIAARSGVKHWDGSTMTVAFTEPGMEVHGVWAVAPDDVWALEHAANGSTSYGVVHFDGTAWTRIDPSVAGYPDVIWGRGSDVWLGVVGHLLHFEQGAWVGVVDSPALNDAVSTISGTGPGDLWFGDSQSLYHWDGATLTTIDTALLAGRATVVATFARGPTELWAADRFGRIYFCDGTTLSLITRPTGSHLTAMWGDAEHIWIAGDSATVMRY